MQDNASVSNNKSSAGGGIFVYGGSFIMQDNASVSDNTATYSGGGMYVLGGTTMKGGTVSGNIATYYGGGVYARGTFTKTGGIIYGDDAEQKIKNTVITRLGNAVYEEKNKNWRNATAGSTINTDSFGFWLNDGDIIMFPSDFVGNWRRSNFKNTLTVSENTMKSSSSDSVWVLQKISGNAYTLKRIDAANTMTITIRLDGRNLVISGDSGSGENNWNGTWQKQY